MDWMTPKGTGEIISDAVAALRQHIGVAFSIAAPVCALDLLLREVASSLLTQSTAAIGDPQSADLGALVAAVPSFAAGLGFFGVSFLVQQLLQGSMYVLAERRARGLPVSARPLLARIGQRGVWLVLTFLLFTLLVGGLSLLALGIPVVAFGAASIALEQPLLTIPGIGLALICGVVVFVVLSLRWALYGPVTILEDVSPWQALKRSAWLTARRGLPFFASPKFRLSLVLLVALALSGTLQSLFLIPRLILAAITGWDFAGGAIPSLGQMPIWFLVPFGLLEVITNAVVMPFGGILLALFATDLRLRYAPDSVLGGAAPGHDDDNA